MSKEGFLSKWIQSDGGPLILMERASANVWNGNSRPNGFQGLTDYERACQLEDYLGLLDVQATQILVFDDEPLQTAYWQIKPDVFLLVRWRWADNEKAVIDVLPDALKREDWEKSGISISISTEDLVMFDAAYRIDEADVSLNFNLSQGHYSVETLFFEPNDRTALILHSLRNINE
jgi:Immunity protein 21